MRYEPRCPLAAIAVLLEVAMGAIRGTVSFYRRSGGPKNYGFPVLLISC
jgi:hypothetical protein